MLSCLEKLQRHNQHLLKLAVNRKFPLSTISKSGQVKKSNFATFFYFSAFIALKLFFI